MLREAEKKVDLERERIVVETQRKVAQEIAEGNRSAEETKAETTKLVAAIARETAELEAQASITLGKSKAGAQELEAEAKSELFALAVNAFGSGAAYN
ncbi:MAG: band 7 protein, partial [Phycisphaerae bacterium]